MINKLDEMNFFYIIKQDQPDYLEGKSWYKRDDWVNALKQMNYSNYIAEELADLFLLHISHAFNRGVYNGVTAAYSKLNKE